MSRTQVLLLCSILFWGCTEKKEEPRVAAKEKVFLLERAETRKMYAESKKALVGKPRDEKALLQACETNNFAACRDLIGRYNRKSSDPKIQQRQQSFQLKYRKKFCAEGHYEVCQELLHFLLREKESHLKVHEEFFAMLKAGCFDDGPKQSRIGFCELLFSYVTNVLHDNELIEKSARAGCDLESPSLCSKLAYRVASTNENEFFALVERVCESDANHCSSLISSRPDHVYSEKIIAKLLEACEKTLHICDQVGRYAFRQANDKLALQVLEIRCQKDIQRCIELALFEYKQEIEGFRMRLNGVCKARQGAKRPFQHHFEKFSLKFCQGDKIQGSPEEWLRFNPNQK